jgi:hypothetical protein
MKGDDNVCLSARPAEELEAVLGVCLGEHLQEAATEQRREPSTWTKNLGRHEIQRVPSFEKPPPGTIICTYGCWVMAEPQVCNDGAIASPRTRRVALGGFL